MKTLFAVLITAFSMNAFSYATYDAGAYTCSEMNTIMAHEQIVYIYNQTGFGGKQIYVDDRRSCGECYRPLVANFKTKTGWCTIGYKCKENRSIVDKDNKNDREKRLARKCRKVWREDRIN